MTDAPEDLATTIPLSHPLVTHQGEIKELKVRWPDLGDLVKNGQPLTIRNGYVPETGEIVLTPLWDMKALAGVLADTTGHDTLVLEDIKAPDVIKIQNAFFTLLSGR